MWLSGEIMYNAPKIIVLSDDLDSEGAKQLNRIPKEPLQIVMTKQTEC